MPAGLIRSAKLSHPQLHVCVSARSNPSGKGAFNLKMQVSLHNIRQETINGDIIAIEINRCKAWVVCYASAIKRKGLVSACRTTQRFLVIVTTALQITLKRTFTLIECFTLP